MRGKESESTGEVMSGKFPIETLVADDDVNTTTQSKADFSRPLAF